MAASDSFWAAVGRIARNLIISLVFPKASDWVWWV